MAASSHALCDGKLVWTDHSLRGGGPVWLLKALCALLLFLLDIVQLCNMLVVSQPVAVAGAFKLPSSIAATSKLKPVVTAGQALGCFIPAAVIDSVTRSGSGCRLWCCLLSRSTLADSSRRCYGYCCCLGHHDQRCSDEQIWQDVE